MFIIRDDSMWASSGWHFALEGEKKFISFTKQMTRCDFSLIGKVARTGVCRLSPVKWWWFWLTYRTEWKKSSEKISLKSVCLDFPIPSDTQHSLLARSFHWASNWNENCRNNSYWKNGSKHHPKERVSRSQSLKKEEKEIRHVKYTDCAPVHVF